MGARVRALLLVVVGVLWAAGAVRAASMPTCGAGVHQWASFNWQTTASTAEELCNRAVTQWGATGATFMGGACVSWWAGDPDGYVNVDPTVRDLCAPAPPGSPGYDGSLGGATTVSLDLPPVLSLTPDQGGQIGLAIAGVWALAFCFRLLARQLMDSEVGTSSSDD